MKIRFQADADFNQNIVRALRRRQPAIDFQTAEEAGLRELTDSEVLAIAGREDRILVSHDRRTMPKHFANFLTLQPALVSSSCRSTCESARQLRNCSCSGKHLKLKNGSIAFRLFRFDAAPASPKRKLLPANPASQPVGHPGRIALRSSFPGAELSWLTESALW